MIRSGWMDASPSRKKKPRHFGRLTGLALALALNAGVAHADLLELSFVTPQGIERVVDPTAQHINPAGTITATLNAGLDRRVRISILSGATVVREVTSHLLSVEDRILVGEKKYFAARLEIDALPEGSYTARAEILASNGESLKSQDFPLVIDRTPPSVGSFSFGMNYGNTSWDGAPASDGLPAISIVEARHITLSGVSDNLSGISESSFAELIFVDGEKAGEKGGYEKLVHYPAESKVMLGTGNMNSISANFLPRFNAKSRIEFHVMDKAGNVTIKSQLVHNNSVCNPTVPELVAIQDPTYGGSYMGHANMRPVLGAGSVPVNTNPVTAIYRVPRNEYRQLPEGSIYGGQAVGVTGGLVHADATYAYFSVGGTVGMDNKISWPSQGFTNYSTWRCYAFEVPNPSFNSATIPPVLKDIKLRVAANNQLIGTNWFTPLHGTLPYNTSLNAFLATVEPRSYPQQVIVYGGVCEVPPGQSQCWGGLNLPFNTLGRVDWHAEWSSVRNKNNPAMSAMWYTHTYVASDNAPLTVDGGSFDYFNKEVTVNATKLESGLVHNRIKIEKGGIKAKGNGKEIVLNANTIDGNGNKYTLNVPYRSLEHGRYEIVAWVEDHFSNYAERSLATIDNDAIPPSVSINAPTVLDSLDRVEIYVSDAESGGGDVKEVRIFGGPINENIQLSARPVGGTLFKLEYPVMFPSLIEGEEYTVEVVGVDAQGNEAVATASFMFDPKRITLINGMDGKIMIPAVPHEFRHNDGSRIIETAPVTLGDGSTLQGSYDVFATVRGDAEVPLLVNGTYVEPGETVTILRAHDFAQNEGRLSISLQAIEPELVGKTDLMISTSAPNTPVLLLDVHTWVGDIVLQSKMWEYRQVIDPLDIIAMPAPGVPCRTTVDEEAARKADPIRDPVCLIKWTETPDEAMVSQEKMGGMTVAGLIGQAVRLGEQSIKYDVFLYSGDGTRVQIGSGERTIDVVSAMNSILFEPTVQTALQKIEQLDVRFQQILGPTCRATLSADEAITASERVVRKDAQLACLFEWQIMPDGLMQNKYGMIPQAEGTLDTVGDHTLGWRLSIFSRLGTRITLAEQTADISVTPPPAPTIRLSSNFDMEDGTFMVPVGESYVGDAVISAENAELTIDIESPGSEVLSERFPRNAWSALQSVTRRIANTDTELWGKREITVRAAYYELPEVSSEETYTVYTVPSTSVRPFIETTAESALDTELLPVTVNMLDMYMYRLPYDEATMGTWNVRVMRQIKAGEYEPLTDFVETVDGVAAFDVDVSSAEGRTIRLVAEAHLVSPIEGYERIEISPRPLFLGVLLGGEIGGDVVARRISGQAPFNAVFRAVLTDRVMFASVGDIVWEVSEDEGATWEQHIQPERQKFSFVQTFNTGTYRVRAKIVNRHSGLEQYTGQVEITAYDKPMIQIEGPKVMFVGTTATLRARTVTESMKLDEDGKRQRVYTEYPQDAVSIDWSVDGGKSYTHTGDVIEISSDDQERISVWARVRTTHSPEDDKNAYTITKSSVEFKEVRPPRIRISGHARVEKGVPYTFTAEATHSYRDMDLPIHGYFTLPDGTRVDADTAVYIPTEDDVLKGRISTTYTAWIEGFREEGAEHTQEIVSRVWQYVWPKFAIDFRTDAQVAPANLTLRVRPLRFSGNLEEPTYEWDLPLDAATVTNANSDTSRQLTINEPGDYEISVTVRDARGNESVVTHPFSIGQADPYTIELNYTASNVYMREPVDITIRPEIRGGHPKDRVETREFFVNGEALEASKLYGRTTLTAGDHEVGLRINSRHGKQEEATMVITVEPNQLPVCEVTHRKSRSAVVVYAECEDPDGRIRDYEWTLNGDPVSTSSRSINVGRRTGGDNPVITVTAVDDSGGRSNTVQFETSFESEDE